MKLSFLGLWFAFMSLYLLRTPPAAFSHDFRGHIQYTRILSFEQRLPHPMEGLETYQPPLYYLLNSVLAGHSPHHIFWVRLLSVFYGGLFLSLCGWALAKFGLAIQKQWAILSFMATTPAFVFLFSTYNNDALATVFGGAMLVAAWSFLDHGNKRALILFTGLATLGVYTKLTVAFEAIAMAIVGGAAVLAGQISRKQFLSLFGSLLMAAILVCPWLWLHNHRFSNRFFPNSADVNPPVGVDLIHGPLKTLLTPPGVTPREWIDPFAHLWEKEGSKKGSYWSYLLSTSCYGEFIFTVLPPILLSLILILHAIFYGGSILLALQKPLGRWAAALLGIGLFIYGLILFHSPFASLMDFRYVAWTWIPTAVMAAIALKAKPRESLWTLWSASFLQAIFLGALVWHAPQWFLP